MAHFKLEPLALYWIASHHPPIMLHHQPENKAISERCDREERKIMHQRRGGSLITCRGVYLISHIHLYHVTAREARHFAAQIHANINKKKLFFKLGFTTSTRHFCLYVISHKRKAAAFGRNWSGQWKEPVAVISTGCELEINSGKLLMMWRGGGCHLRKTGKSWQAP